MDIYRPCTSGVPRQGTAIVNVNLFGYTHEIGPSVARNFVVSQSGILTDRCETDQYIGVVTHSRNDEKGNQKTTISNTSETTIVTAESGMYKELYGIMITNTSATDTTIAIKDATGGTTRFNFGAKAGTTTGFALPSCDGHKQTLSGNNWTATAAASVSSLEITAMFLTKAE